MRIYTALLKYDAEPVLVREGFSWGALLFGGLWLAIHRAWVPAAVSLAVYVLIIALAPQPARAVLETGLAVLLGLTGQDLRRWSLEQRGYLLAHVLSAADSDDAFTRLMSNRPDLAVRYRPEPA